MARVLPVALATIAGVSNSDALLAKVLEDPSIVPALGTWTMPNLNLRQSEVAALVAFINKPRAVP